MFRIKQCGIQSDGQGEKHSYRKRRKHMITVYGSKMCPDCVACEANFEHYNVEYQFRDIMADLRNLKKFLIYRDTMPEVFDRLIKIHDIGIPACVTEDGQVFTDWESYLKNQGLEPIAVNAAPACSIDHKGC